ncbi:MAG: hypothetical protein RIC19_10470 [Phaeodactylibacter sp.]|uniref:hypothetical protein n=1 Tax=Phaeodactylibacter sp. TaxID=1940289 RepID=UPI0032EE756D
MIRKDYFLKVLQQLTQVIARALQLSHGGDAKAALELLDEQYQKQLQEQSEILVNYPVEALAQHYDEGQLTLLADLLMAEGEILMNATETGAETARARLSKALSLYQHLNQVQQVYDFEREGKMQQIRAWLEAKR